MTATAIDVHELRKSYGDVEAVRGIDLAVGFGEVLAVLGPNGAGKTTLLEILEGYRSRDAGDVAVLGVDPARPSRAWRSRIGIVLQECNLTPQLTVRESVTMYAGYFLQPRPVDETIELVGLAPQADRRVGKLSGGQQRRLDVALALIGDPELIFLDEPTTGFDPEARRDAWQMISGLSELGKTIVLTTHYIEEAQELADRVVVIAAGKIVAEGTPAELTTRDQLPTRIEFSATDGAPLPSDASVSDGRVTIETDRPTAVLAELTGWAAGRGTELPDLQVVRPSLEDVYLRLIKASE